MFGLVSGVALVEFAQPYEYEALYLYVLRYPVKGQLVMIERIQHTNTVQVRMYLPKTQNSNCTGNTASQSPQPTHMCTWVGRSKILEI